jgi:hypothetical protein
MTSGGDWYNPRVDCLQYACTFYDYSYSLFQDGLDKLVHHRQNYGEEGPATTRLQLLWWEFPDSQWEEIRIGGSMNFLMEPVHQIQPNSPMGPEELQVADEFVNGLVTLGVLCPPADDEGNPIDVVTNAPLHCTQTRSSGPISLFC